MNCCVKSKLVLIINTSVFDYILFIFSNTEVTIFYIYYVYIFTNIKLIKLLNSNPPHTPQQIETYRADKQQAKT